MTKGEGKHPCEGSGDFEEVDRTHCGVHHMSGSGGRTVRVAGPPVAHHRPYRVGNAGDDNRLGNRRRQGIEETGATRLEASPAPGSRRQALVSHLGREAGRPAYFT